MKKPKYKNVKSTFNLDPEVAKRLKELAYLNDSTQGEVVKYLLSLCNRDKLPIRTKSTILSEGHLHKK